MSIATTFRFSDEVRDELERIKLNMGLPTLQKTVEALIQTDQQREEMHKNVLERARKAETECELYRQRLIAIRGTFRIILDYPISGDEK